MLKFLDLLAQYWGNLFVISGFFFAVFKYAYPISISKLWPIIFSIIGSSTMVFSIMGFIVRQKVENPLIGLLIAIVVILYMFLISHLVDMMTTTNS